jgi:hypothetical protein
VTANYFAVLGTRAAAGRLFLGDEDRVPDGAPVAVISHAFWVRRFGASPEVVGTAIRINGRPYAIVGVTEPGFRGTTFVGTDMWVPFAMAPHVTGRGTMELLTEHGPVWHLGVARLKEGVTAQQARDELTALLAPLKETHAEVYGRWSVAVLPSARVPGELRGPVLSFVGVLFALTGMVLAIASSNVAGMLLARGMARRSRRWSASRWRGGWWRSCSRSCPLCQFPSSWISRWTSVCWHLRRVSPWSRQWPSA